jgi:RimJ/RimL family protein N-acetyltransferase
MDDTILRTERLLLRYQRKSDIEFLVYLWMDEEMTEYTGGPRDRTFLIDEFRKIAEDPEKLEYDLWPIELTETHELVGHAGFIPKEVNGKEYLELNYYIDKYQWNKGYGKEISWNLIRFAFEAKRVDKVISIIDPDNVASQALARSIGMEFWLKEERNGKIKIIYIIKIEDAK